VFDATDIVIPICNEAGTVEALLSRLRAACPEARLIFVDNASTDGTLERLRRFADVVVIRHEQNLGYGRSIRDGMRAASRRYVIVIDADLEYQPEDLPAMVAALVTAPAVHGSRFLGGGAGAHLGVVRRFGNAAVTRLFNALFRQHLTDLYTGVRAFERSAVPLARLRYDGFEFVLELSARLAQAGVRIAEVPVRYQPRTTGRSKMRHVREFVKFAWYLMALRLSG